MSEVTDRDLFPPGEIYSGRTGRREEWTQDDLAVILKRPLKAINQIIQGKKAITPKTWHTTGGGFRHVCGAMDEPRGRLPTWPGDG